MHVRVRMRVHVTGGVLARDLTCVGRLSEQPHWRWPKQDAAGQTRWPWRAEWPLQGIPSEKAGSGGCGPISTNHVALFGLSCTRFTLHLALAIFQQGIPCFGHRPWPNSRTCQSITIVSRNRLPKVPIDTYLSCATI